MNRKITNEVVEGSMIFIKALINDHHADAVEAYEQVAAACFARAGMLKAADAERNR